MTSTPSYPAVADALRALGLRARGGFHVSPGDDLPGAGTVVMIGNVGGELWDVFPHTPEAQDGAADGLDRWSRRVIEELAARFGGRAIFPFDGPPYVPFQRWAQRSEPVFPSPVGMLIHPDYGLWHAYRGALALPGQLALPESDPRPRPCDTCADQPCLTTCPVNAFRADGYDVAACAEHLNGPDGGDCMTGGCLARRACPVGTLYRYESDQASWHMAAFRRAVTRRAESEDQA